MIRQGLDTLDEKSQQPFERDPHGATNATQGDLLHQQTFDEAPLFTRDEVLLAALDKLASTVVAVLLLHAVVNVAIFLVLGRLTPWAHISDHHGWLLTSSTSVCFQVNSSTEGP